MTEVLKTRPLALITGASAGIGKAFAHLLAREGYDLMLVARDEQRLKEVAAALETKHGASSIVRSVDLSDRVALDVLCSEVATQSRPVNLLVNNAGFGLNQRFSTGDVEREQYMLDVLVTAVMRLTHAVVSREDKQIHDIIVVSSVASFIAGGTYSAAKAWATVFAESLSTELSPRGVRVSALCPGFTHTEFHDRAGIKKSDIPGWLWLDVDDMVAAGWRMHQRGKVVTVPGWQYRLLQSITKFGPRSRVRKIGFRARNRYRP
jgi:short-subunit dehydrogenase